MKVKRVALTSLAVAAFTLFAGQAQALGLGRLNVQSSLGEALRAEIDVTSLAADEASSLQIRIASPETYRAAGVEYHPALASARVVLARRADGRPFLRVTSDRVVTEPFVDVILEMNWATGRLVREYTLLLDPPRGGSPAGTPTSPIVAAAPAPAPSPAPASAAAAPAAVATPAAVAPAPAPAPSAAAPASAPAPAPDPVPVAAAAPAPAPAPAPKAAAAPRRPAARAATPVPAPQQAASRPAEVRVRSGDTLTGIAQRVQPSGISLDQLLVSMFRANPQAFAGDNMNRLRAGAILKVPEASDAQNVPQGEARSVIQAQSADFNAYRRRLATGVAGAPDSTPSRQGSGKVQASVDDRKQAAAPAPDKLKLSQGAVKASAPEAKISRDTAAKDSSTRVAELSRNLDDLKKVQGAATAAAGTAAKPPAAAPSAGVGIPVPGSTVVPPPKVAAAPTPAPAPAAPPSPVKPPVVASAPALTPTPPPVIAPAPAPMAAASAAVAPPTVVASAPAPMPTAPSMAGAKPASAPPVAAAPKPPVAVPSPDDEPSLLTKIMESPFVLPFGAVLAAALAGFGIYRVRSRSSKTAGETSFMESRLQPDSFFGASGGQRVDTHEGGGGASTVGTASSMNYSLSQLDAIGDVDPVAEADVYLAYGRDLQAEEILKEAMRTDPGRLAVRTKLLEVYAKRRDVKGFELLANQLFTLTRGEGADWSKAQELGRSIDPENPLYHSGGRPEDAPDEDQFVEPLGASTMPHSVMPSASNFGTPNDLADPEPEGVSVSDVDIDLTFDPDELDEPERRDRNAPLDATMPFTPANLAAMGASKVAADDIIDVEATERRGAPDASKETLDFDLSDLSLDLDPPAKPAAATAPAASFKDSEPAAVSGFVDLSGLPDDPDSRFNDDGDPLERKLDLADEFRQIGDMEGARDLLNEVIEQADGALKQKAQTMLDSLG